MATIDTSTLHVLPVQDTAIAYTDSGGHGDPLLLVHAGVFGAWLAPLAAEPALQGFRTIRMLRAGYTDGPIPNGHLGITDHAAHCAALLDTLDAAPAHVVAHSSATEVALQLALNRPDAVRSLVLSEPPLVDCFAAPEDLPFLNTTLGPALGASIAAAASGEIPTAFDTFMSTVCGADYRQVLTSALGTDGLARAERDSRFFFADEIRAVTEWDFDESAAARIHQPVLLVQGGASNPVVHRLVTHLAAMLPHSEIATIPDDDHLLPLRSPERLGHLVAEFTRCQATTTGSETQQPPTNGVQRHK